jgi:hypothetical protein
LSELSDHEELKPETYFEKELVGKIMIAED